MFLSKVEDVEYPKNLPIWRNASRGYPDGNGVVVSGQIATPKCAQVILDNLENYIFDWLDVALAMI